MLEKLHHKNSVARLDAFSKVTGEAKYVDDLVFPRMLHVQTVRSPYAHARILSIDGANAQAFPGVVAVFTAKDLPGVNQLPKDKPVLAAEVVRYVGDGVAIVVAETKKAALAGARLVNVAYEALPAVLTPEEALAAGAPEVHEGGNVAGQHVTRKGDIARGFEEADVILERTYATQRALHGAIEPDGAVALPENGGVLLYCPGKGPFNIKRAVAQACGLEDNKVRLIQPAIGGAFGGKDYDINIIASRCAMAALLTKRPCKMIWSREEVFAEGTRRHPFTLHYKVGARKDGTITAMQIDGIADVGAYLSKSLATIWRATVEATGPYAVANVSTTIKGVFTNNPYSDAVRGFGSPQVDFASESLIDELALELAIDPLTLRRMNAYTDGAVTATGQCLESVNLLECLDCLEEKFLSSEPAQSPAPHKVRGRGISCIFRGEAMGAGFPIRDAAVVNINVEKDGSVVVLSGIAEMGQGGGNIVLQLISEVIGLSMEHLRLSPLDTAYVPDSGATVGSRGTITSGNAAYAAAVELRNRMSEIVARHWNVRPDEILFAGNKLSVPGRELQMQFADAVGCCLKELPCLQVSGSWALPPVWWDFEKQCGETYASFTFGACGVDLEIDLISGAIELVQCVSVHDVGRALNVREVQGQIAGGASMGYGLALLEQDLSAGEARVTRNFDTYLLPTMLDFPALEAIPLEARPGSNPIGVKGVGEPASAIIAPAIINAIANALQVRIRKLPANLEAVFAAIEKRDRIRDASKGVADAD